MENDRRVRQLGSFSDEDAGMKKRTTSVASVSEKDTIISGETRYGETRGAIGGPKSTAGRSRTDSGCDRSDVGVAGDRREGALLRQSPPAT